MSGLRLFGVAVLNGESHSIPPGTEVVTFKDLAAVVSETPYEKMSNDVPTLTGHHDVVDRVFAYHAVIPAPAGIIFRSRESLQRWLELHYFTLSDGLAFVEGRCVARVHIQDTDYQRDIDERRVLGTELFRELRREAAAAIPLKRDEEQPEDEILRAAFLIERSRWDHFKSRALGEERRHGGVSVSITGPWPPYDFVRLQFSR